MINTEKPTVEQFVGYHLTDFYRWTLGIYKKGTRNWEYARFFPGGEEGFGEIIFGAEPSPCYPESEYFGRSGSPKTFATYQNQPSWNPDYGWFEWMDDEEGDWVASPGGSEFLRFSDLYENLKEISGWLGVEPETLEELSNEEIFEKIKTDGGYRFSPGSEIDNDINQDCEKKLEELYHLIFSEDPELPPDDSI